MCSLASFIEFNDCIWAVFKFHVITVTFGKVSNHYLIVFTFSVIFTFLLTPSSNFGNCNLNDIMFKMININSIKLLRATALNDSLGKY